MERLEWSERLIIEPSTDVSGEVDYAKIDEFYLVNGHYYLSQRIISAGIVRANSIKNGIASGRFTPKK